MPSFQSNPTTVPSLNADDADEEEEDVEDEEFFLFLAFSHAAATALEAVSDSTGANFAPRSAPETPALFAAL